jgi:catechol 2,3-dioxygenase-like lactoylglutathione lyase family enzyme
MLMCDDVPASIAFYTEVLGLEVEGRMDRIGRSGWASLIKVDAKFHDNGAQQFDQNNIAGNGGLSYLKNESWAASSGQRQQSSPSPIHVACHRGQPTNSLASGSNHWADRCPRAGSRPLARVVSTRWRADGWPARFDYRAPPWPKEIRCCSRPRRRPRL